MSEPRKLYTAGATGSSEQEQYEAARRRAQQLAEQNARRRTVRRPGPSRNRSGNPYRSRCSSLSSKPRPSLTPRVR